ncbi:N-acetylmuramoyl-L-alanine amidase [Marinoscillum furvescens]|uniref:Putative secreted protein (Por secretion system target) n=1 Tax=Marinoscillum furvescens DSM 4134 TaxID=1122208 RepID=A0A3D9L6A1_MARFU|nr:N-acetylmuramoyl-L-alanine amidase [Marinoscillum furvescens]REE00420.1 putative secreted protein (Por secretion system target) [Marinoscillum furvescens DSM 4134]
MFRLLIFLAFCGPFFCQAQSQAQVTRWNTDQSDSRKTNHPVSAVVVRSESYQGLSVTLQIDGSSYEIPYDPDAPEYSYFISLPEVISFPSSISPEGFDITLIYSGEVPKIKPRNQRVANDCNDAPPTIPQSEWREGLPEPDYNRAFTNVQHVIVHHAAGSNTNTNYTQVVRDIYLYHTQSNGWSDVGYNYLIAQNGDIYNGRDPGAGEQDNVRGAHFCGKNSYTMGICLLGNYETAQPTSSTLESLEQLIAFKLEKEGLDPLGSSSHPAGQVGHIAGHRDGCATACPGTNVYNKLDDVRVGVQEKMTQCDTILRVSIAPENVEPGEEVTFTNKSNGFESYKWLLEGADPSEANWTTDGKATYAAEGTFDLTLIGYRGSESDTMRLEDVVTVVEKELKLTVSSQQVVEGGQITFTNASYGYDRYSWNLEGAEPSSTSWSSSGSANYYYAGTYDVQLTGFYGDRSHTYTLTDYITVTELDKALKFSVNDQETFEGYKVTFTNESFGYDRYTWKLEGADPQTADWSDSGMASYAEKGSYDVELIGHLGSRQDVLLEEDFISVSVRELGLLVSDITLDAGQEVTFTNTSVGYESYQWYLEGGDPQNPTWEDVGTATYRYGGTFDIQLIGTHGTTSDTLAYEDFLLVKSDLMLLPNLVSSGGEVALATDQEIKKVTLMDAGGKVYFSITSPLADKIQLPALDKGIYFLDVETSRKRTRSKLLVK